MNQSQCNAVAPEKNSLPMLKEFQEVGSRSVVSDFVFVPHLGDDRGWLLIRSAETPVLDGPQICIIQITETVSGEGRNLVRAMDDANEFNATIYEDGDQRSHAVARKIRCKFIGAAPARRDWECRSEIYCYKVSLEMSVESETGGIMRLPKNA